MLKNAYISKSFYWLGKSLDNCFNCKYCRAKPNLKCEYNIIPTEINPIFTNLPIVINLFYGDPLLQIESTKKYLEQLQESQHKAPIIIITKGNLKNLGDMDYDLNINIALSTIGIKHPLDNIGHYNLINNLKYISKYDNINFSCEFRPIMYQINDNQKIIDELFHICCDFKLPIGYSGIQVDENLIKYWNENNIQINPFPGYNFSKKKPISNECFEIIKNSSLKYNVPIFKKTSCLISFSNHLNRDYNAHYYRPNELMCSDCIMKEKCLSFKKNQDKEVDYNNFKNIIPFDFEIITKNNHHCLLYNTCPNPHSDCNKITGNLIKINKEISTADVRIIKWLTGYTVDAPFFESNEISKDWLSK